jgi:isopenicillin-N N-acyltransferase-like protein
MYSLSRRDFIKQAAILGILPFTNFGVSPIQTENKKFPELELQGSHGHMGMQHGRIFNSLIQKNIQFYKEWILGGDKNRINELIEAASRFGPVLRDYVPEQLEEIEGIARGAEVSVDDILIINARTDLKFMFEKSAAEKNQPGCTALAIKKGEGVDALLALGQNWDWNLHFKDTAALLRINPDEGPSIVMFTEAGMVGKIGFNHHRLGVCLNYLEHASNLSHESLGVPVHNLLRTVLTSRTASEAYSKVALFPRCGTANFLIAQFSKTGSEIMDIEITPDAVAIIRPEKEYLLHTNHYVSPSLKDGCMSMGGVSTTNRYETGYSLLDSIDHKEADPVETMKKVLELREGAPYSVSRSPAPGSQSSTIAGIVMDLSRNFFYLAPGSPHENPWVTYPGA